MTIHSTDDGTILVHPITPLQVGILSMASNGEPHTANSQFFITLDALPWLDGKRVAFGKVLTQEGLKVRGFCSLSTALTSSSWPPVGS